MEDVLNVLTSKKRPLTGQELIEEINKAKGTVYWHLRRLIARDEIERVTVKVSEEGNVKVLYKLKKEQEEEKWEK